MFCWKIKQKSAEIYLLYVCLDINDRRLKIQKLQAVDAQQIFSFFSASIMIEQLHIEPYNQHCLIILIIITIEKIVIAAFRDNHHHIDLHC